MGMNFVGWVALAILAPLILAFQNCTSPRSETGAKSSLKVNGPQTAGNGGTYDGKPYVSLLADGVCADGSNVKTAVAVNSKTSATLLRENCADIVPRPVTLASDALYEHNVENLIFGEAVLNASGAPSTSLLCRGSEVRTYSEGDFLVVEDAVIQDLKGQVKVGIYTAGDETLVKSLASGDLQFKRTVFSNQMVYSAADPEGDTVINITLHRVGLHWEGMMLYHLAGNMPAPSPSPALRPPPGPGSGPVLLSVHGAPGYSVPVKCYEP